VSDYSKKKNKKQTRSRRRVIRGMETIKRVDQPNCVRLFKKKRKQTRSRQLVIRGMETIKNASKTLYDQSSRGCRRTSRACLDAQKHINFFFHSTRHIETLDLCMEN
jgi:hypothetical protein